MRPHGSSVRYLHVLLLATLPLAACGRDAAVEAGGGNTYLRYCASCPGSEGKGDGPLAAEFEEEGRGEPYPAYQGLLKSRLLVDYLGTIQEE